MSIKGNSLGKLREPNELGYPNVLGYPNKLGKAMISITLDCVISAMFKLLTLSSSIRLTVIIPNSRALIVLNTLSYVLPQIYRVHVSYFANE